MSGAQHHLEDHRPGDVDGWAGLSAELKAYERARADASRTAHAVRAGDVLSLERGLAALLPG